MAIIWYILQRMLYRKPYIHSNFGTHLVYISKIIHYLLYEEQSMYDKN